jgi:hypothetical protein
MKYEYKIQVLGRKLLNAMKGRWLLHNWMISRQLQLGAPLLDKESGMCAVYLEGSVSNRSACLFSALGAWRLRGSQWKLRWRLRRDYDLIRATVCHYTYWGPVAHVHFTNCKLWFLKEYMHIEAHGLHCPWVPLPR